MVSWPTFFIYDLYVKFNSKNNDVKDFCSSALLFKINHKKRFFRCEKFIYQYKAYIRDCLFESYRLITNKLKKNSQIRFTPNFDKWRIHGSKNQIQILNVNLYKMGTNRYILARRLRIYDFYLIKIEKSTF